MAIIIELHYLSLLVIMTFEVYNRGQNLFQFFKDKERDPHIPPPRRVSSYSSKKLMGTYQQIRSVPSRFFLRMAFLL